MEFTLYYQGVLTSNAKSKHKHAIRKTFHKQLRELWNQVPLVHIREEPNNPDSEPASSWVVDQKKFRFVPLVSSKRHMIARIRVDMLLPGSPGQIVGRGGDIDNRLKTLLDSLTMPNADQTPDEEPDESEDPFFCLLEDDKLITGLSVDTNRLLKKEPEANEVLLLIHVETSLLARTFENIDL